jgi:hypothetical protein
MTVSSNFVLTAAPTTETAETMSWDDVSHAALGAIFETATMNNDDSMMNGDRDDDVLHTPPPMEVGVEEVVFVVELPVVDPHQATAAGSVSEMWNLTPPVTEQQQPPPSFANDLMACVNPWDVEGREPLIDVEPFVSMLEQEEPRKKRPNLRLIMPSTAAKPPMMLETLVAKIEDVAAADGLTPAIEKSLIRNSEASFDLLAYVTDHTIKVDDPQAIAFMGTSPDAPSPVASTSYAASTITSTINIGDIMPLSTSSRIYSEPPKGKRRQRKQTEKAKAIKEEAVASKPK